MGKSSARRNEKIRELTLSQKLKKLLKGNYVNHLIKESRDLTGKFVSDGRPVTNKQKKILEREKKSLWTNHT